MARSSDASASAAAAVDIMSGFPRAPVLRHPWPPSDAIGGAGAVALPAVCRMLMSGLPDAKEAKGGGKPRSKPRQQQAKPRKAAAAAVEEEDEMAEAEGRQPGCRFAF